MWLSGARDRDIAHELGIPLKMVYVYAKVLGLPPRRKPPANRKITDEDLELMSEMWFEGATLKEIAEYLGVSEYSVRQYLHAMGLRRRVLKRCPKIPREKLERLCLEGRADREIAEMYNTSVLCVAKLRQKYGISRRELAKKRSQEKRNKIVETIVKILSEKGFTTSRELRESYSIIVTKELLRELEDFVEGLRWFRLRYTSTHKYLVFPPRLNGVAIIYLQGEEMKVIDYLLSNLAGFVPRIVIRQLLIANSATKELYELL